MSTSRRTWVLLCTPYCRGYVKVFVILRVGSDVLVITWLDRGRRDVLAVHPRGDAAWPVAGASTLDLLTGPAPLGLHRVTIQAIDRTRVSVRNLEALDERLSLDGQCGASLRSSLWMRERTTPVLCTVRTGCARFMDWAADLWPVA
jgi:hypothetical protein